MSLSLYDALENCFQFQASPIAVVRCCCVFVWVYSCVDATKLVAVIKLLTLSSVQNILRKSKCRNGKNWIKCTNNLVQSAIITNATHIFQLDAVNLKWCDNTSKYWELIALSISCLDYYKKTVTAKCQFLHKQTETHEKLYECNFNNSIGMQSLAEMQIIIPKLIITHGINLVGIMNSFPQETLEL